MARSLLSSRRRLVSSVLALVVMSSMLVLATSPAEAKSKATPKISVKASATTITARESTTLSGKVSRVKTPEKVVLKRKSGKKWVSVKTIRTAKSGKFTYAFRPPAGAQSYRVEKKATSKLKAARSKTLRVTVLTPGTVSASVSPAELEVGQSALVTGSANPFQAGAPVELQRANGGTWSTVATSVVTGGGTFSIPHAPAAGVWSYRVVKPRDGLHAAATSSPVTTDAAGPASLMVDIVGLPAGRDAAVTVTGPTGSQSLTSSKTLASVARGAWTVTASDVTVATDGYYPTTPSQTVTIARGQSQLVTVNYGIVVPETTQVLESGEVTDLEQQSEGIAELTVASSADVSTGDVVAAGVGPSTPTGLLGKVTAVDGQQVTVDTTDVTLLDAVDAGTFDVSMPLTNDDVVDPGELADGDVEPLNTNDFRAQAVKQAADDSSVSREMNRNLTCQAGGSAEIGAEFEFKPTVKFNATWELFQGVTSAQLTAGIEQTSQVKATLSGAASCTLERSRVLNKPVTFRPITFVVGPVPVVLVPTLQFYIDGSAGFEATAEAGAQQKFTADAGLRYVKNSGFTPVQAVSSTVSQIGPSFAGEATAVAGVAPELKILLYGVAGPRVYVRGSVEADAQAAAAVGSASLDWNIDARLKGAAAMDIDALNLHSGELEIFNRKWDVANGRLAYTPPPAAVITTTSLPNATVGTAYNQQLKTADNRPGAWSISAGSLPAGLSLNGDRITGTPTAAGTRTFTVRFKPGGTADTQSLTLTVGAADGSSDPGWTNLAAGSWHSCGTRAGGELYCWGESSSGQLGVGDTTLRSTTPTRVGAATDWTTITVGETHTCGTRAGGALYCWGDNGNGQLGIGDYTERVTPTRVGDATDWTSVTAGMYNTCGTRAGGALYCWGSNEWGQLGVGDNTLRSTTPTRVGAATDWSSVTAGNTHLCGTRAGGELYCWGYNSSGQLGIGDNTLRFTPARVGVATDWSSVTVGENHTCGTRGGGELHCWGSNGNGQLAIDHVGDRYTPARVGDATDWTNIAIGSFSTCGTRTGGELYCWGYNEYGQLGVGDTAFRFVPTRVGDATDWTNIAIGNSSTCGTRTGGELYCWGYNEYGQLGVGDTTDRSTPTRVGGPA